MDNGRIVPTEGVVGTQVGWESIFGNVKTKIENRINILFIFMFSFFLRSRFSDFAMSGCLGCLNKLRSFS